VPADDLETEVGTQLLHKLIHFDLFEEAANATFADVADDRPHLEAECANTEAQLRETTAARNRYLRAFETEAMPTKVCAPRVAELSARRDELTAHRNRLDAELRTTTPQLPSSDQLIALCAEIERIMAHGSADVVKQLFEELIDRVEITPQRDAFPTPECLTWTSPDQR
jgi:hypothetical protein